MIFPLRTNGIILRSIGRQKIEPHAASLLAGYQIPHDLDALLIVSYRLAPES